MTKLKIQEIYDGMFTFALLVSSTLKAQSCSCKSVQSSSTIVSSRLNEHFNFVRIVRGDDFLCFDWNFIRCVSWAKEILRVTIDEGFCFTEAKVFRDTLEYRIIRPKQGKHVLFSMNEVWKNFCKLLQIVH